MPRALGLGLLALLLALPGCGSAGSSAATADLPTGCTHHLVFAREGPAAGGRIALSFDDTPSPYTEGIYQTLLRHHDRATFFVIGNRIPGHEALLRAMLASGMELANHSYTHPRDLATQGEGASLELQADNAAVEQAAGFRPCLFRPPYGVLTPELVQRAKLAGLTTAKWTVDPADWTHPGAGAIREGVLSGARAGAIVIMHDNTETQGQTLEALPSILEGLRARGLHTATISELLGDRLLYGHA
ncbi:MAG TPA: polysaccharide deacetylase family protein [Solirubrobacteraceae bacterium]|jgi:peptidoglycan/xylan/chitin deacetylase (PgdA/CDA1 family)|nr:polysaccharide deacetylase family protein [Solirubrobacteraceae bacterium]